MTRRFTQHAEVAVGLTLTAIALTACGSSGSDETSEDKADGSSVTVDFWGWAPGYAEAVEAYNASHPDAKVTFTTTPPGSKGGYTKMFSAVKAGNGPCLAQVGYESLPSFMVEGALMDVAKYTGDTRSQFVDWSWNQVKLGDAVYGVPLDTGPMAMYYRKDIFEKHKIPVPATWDAFRSAAEQLHKADPKAYIANLAPGPDYNLAGLSWQNGGKWFSIEGDAWKVDVDGPKTQQVVSYWQELADRGLVTKDEAYGPKFFKNLQDGNVATWVSAVWASPIIQENAKASAGKWAVAPMPQWTPGGKTFGNEGGSSTAVLKGCKNPEKALEFATWLSTAPESLKILIPKTGIYPASKAGLEMPEVNKAEPFFDGQKIYDVFRESAAGTDTSWQWGPTTTQMTADLNDAFGKALTSGGSLGDAMDQTQKKTVDGLKAKGLTVTE
jgi:multiple sugar transport system substrate-binding protein